MLFLLMLISRSIQAPQAATVFSGLLATAVISTAATLLISVFSSAAFAARLATVALQQQQSIQLACGGGGNGAERKPARPGTDQHQ